MTELSFLIELLLNHDLPKETKALIASRIKDVEANLVQRPVGQAPAWVPPPNTPPQAASTLALMAKHGELSPQMVPTPTVVAPQQAAATAQAAALRTAQLAAIAEENKKAPKGTTGARKW